VSQSQAIIDAYAELLQQPALQAEARERALELVQSRSLWMDGRSILGVLRPCIVSEAEYARIRVLSGCVARALRTAAMGLSADEARLREVCGERYRYSPRILAVDRERAWLGFGRLDGFRQPDGGIRFLENNPQWAGRFPGGLVWNDVITELFEDLEATRRLCERFTLRRIGTRAHLSATLASSGNSLGYVVDREFGALALSDQEAEAVLEHAHAEGFEVFFSDAEDYLDDGERLRAPSGEAVSTLFAVPESQRAAEEISGLPLFTAYAEGRVHISGGLQLGRLLGEKALFEVLSDERYAAWFDAETRATLRACIPWTRRVRAMTTELEGRRIELLEYAATHKDALVLKPTAALGGEGVVVGRAVNEETWARTLRTAIEEQSWVVQSHVTAPRARFPFITERGVDFLELAEDFCPYTWPGDVDGALTRVSGGVLMNATAGLGTFAGLLIGGER